MKVRGSVLHFCQDNNSRHEGLAVQTSHLSVGMFTTGTELSSSLFIFFFFWLFLLLIVTCSYFVWLGASLHSITTALIFLVLDISQSTSFRSLGSYPPQKVKRILKKILSLHTYLLLLFFGVFG